MFIQRAQTVSANALWFYLQQLCVMLHLRWRSGRQSISVTWWALAWLLLLVRVYSCVLDTEPRAPESARSKELMHLMQESRARRVNLC